MHEGKRRKRAPRRSSRASAAHRADGAVPPTPRSPATGTHRAAASPRSVPRRARGAAPAGTGQNAGMWVGRIVGSLLVLIGGLWTLQGFGVVGGSFMTGSTIWLVIGLVTVVAGHRAPRARGAGPRGR